MTRQSRKKSKTGIYHIMLRGINRQTIFEDDEDCAKLIETIQQSKEKSGFELYGYCLMGNHVHLLLREGKESLSLSMVLPH
jgi:REP element-mobilizing transposase RayT